MKYKHRGFFGRIPAEPHALFDRLTPTEKCIVLCHLGIPEVDESHWRLDVGGLVERPTKLSLAQLKSFPKTTVTSVHQCAGSPLAPQTPTRRVCNVTWAGVRLQYVLNLVGVHPSAQYVWSRGLDEGEYSGVACGTYLKDMPIERASEDVLLAYEMNGSALLPEHGYPARLVIPGYYGTNSVKWLSEIVLAAKRATSPFTTTWYNDRLSDNHTRPVWAIAPQSIIVSPAPETRLRMGEQIQVWGWAWADGGVAEVKMSPDEGRTWLACRLERTDGRSWQKFVCDWTVGPANQLASRAVAKSGASQPAEGERNAFQSVPIKVG